MMHAIDDTAGKKYLGTIPPLEPAEQNLLINYNDFFRRAAIHMLCDQIKKTNGMDTKVTNHIKWKWDSYMKMLTSTRVAGKGGYDAVFTYGLDREKDAALITKLQQQFRDASMACYELGYLVVCPEWKRYTTSPEYWFKVFEQRILSTEHMNKWAVQSVDTTPTDFARRDGKEWVLVWSNKLSLLKHAAEKQGKDISKIDIEHISNTLLDRLHQQPAYSLLVNDELVKNITAVSFRDLIYRVLVANYALAV
jgi:hypothetical protein